MSKEIKRIDIKEFREKGYLQELNRRFLHPLGLALEVIINEKGEHKLGGIWDFREDLEGIYYDLKNSDNKRIERFRKNSNYIDDKLNTRKEKRTVTIGSLIELIPGNTE